MVLATTQFVFSPRCHFGSQVGCCASDHAPRVSCFAKCIAFIAAVRRAADLGVPLPIVAFVAHHCATWLIRATPGATRTGRSRAGETVPVLPGAKSAVGHRFRLLARPSTTATLLLRRLRPSPLSKGLLANGPHVLRLALPPLAVLLAGRLLLRLLRDLHRPPRAAAKATYAYTPDRCGAPADPSQPVPRGEGWVEVDADGARPKVAAKAPSEASFSRWGTSPEDIRQAQVSTVACWHRPGAPAPLRDDAQRRAWAASRADMRARADPEASGASLKAAKESGIMPKFILPLVVEPLPPNGAPTSSVLLGDFRLGPDDDVWNQAVQLSPFARVHPLSSISDSDTIGASVHEARLGREDDDGFTFTMFATKVLKFAKFTLAIALDYPFGVQPAKWDHDAVERLKDAGVVDLISKNQGARGVPTGNLSLDEHGNLVVPTSKACGYATVAISRMAAPVGDERLLEKVILAIYVLESHYSDSQMSSEQNQWIGEEVCRLRFDDLNNNSLLHVSVVVRHNGHLWMRSWCTGGRLFATATGGKTVMSGPPRARVELRAIDPTVQDACGAREVRTEIVWHDKRANLKLQTDSVTVPAETMRIANPGNATNNLIKEAQAAGSPVDGPDPNLGPKLVKSVRLLDLEERLRRLRAEAGCQSLGPAGWPSAAGWAAPCHGDPRSGAPPWTS